MEEETVPEIPAVDGGYNVVDEQAENDEDGFGMDVDPREEELKNYSRPHRMAPYTYTKHRNLKLTENHLKHYYFKFGNDSIGSTCPSHITCEM